MIQLAWRFLDYQKESVLAKWFRARTENARGSRCLEILRKLRRLYPSQPHHLLFPGTRGRPMSDMTLTKVLRDKGLADKATVHGFRSSFKVWCAEAASEAALAHSVSGSVRAAYSRTEFLEERKGLMIRWAAYCCP